MEKIAPQLDAALGNLNEADRDALLLRYVERKSAHEMAQILGLSEEAAQKRVQRAVERLRDYFSKRNVSIGAGGLAAVISANAVQSAPIGLAATVTSAALVGSTIHASAAIAAASTIAMTTIQKVVITAAFAIVAGTGAYEAHHAAQWREQFQQLQQQQGPVAEEIQRLERERDDATNQLASLSTEVNRLNSGQDARERVTLRSKVGRLQDQLQRLPASRAAFLKQKFEEMPEKKIPELALLTPKDWENAAWDADLDSDDGIRVTLRDARNKAVGIFLNLTRPALKKYLAVNNDILPPDLSPLKPYFEAPVTDEMLARYTIAQSGKLSANLSEDVVRETAAIVDEDYDSRSMMSMNGAGGSVFNNVQTSIAKAAFAFTIENGGKAPSDPSQISSYLTKPIAPTTVQKYLGPIAADITANFPPTETAALIPAFKAYASANGGEFPGEPSQLLPYLTKPDEQAALHRLYMNTYPAK